MSSFVRVTPLSGAQNEAHLCTILEVDEARIMLDCGWTEKFQKTDIEYLANVCRNLDAILITHGDLDHIGGIVYAFHAFGVRCPIYCTTPVHDMGRMMMYEMHASKSRQEDFNLFTRDSIESCFKHMTVLRYSQPLKLSGRCAGMTITAFSSGRTLGGTVWKIRKLSEEIVYAVDYNHRRERHLNGSALINNDAIMRPTLLITDALNAENMNIEARRERETLFVDAILGVLQNGGTVLIPTDTSLRSLELTYLLDQIWSLHRLSFPVVFLSVQGSDTLNFAKSSLEWMGDAIAQSFASRELPFELRNIKIAKSLEDLERIHGAQVILAPSNGLETGFARELLHKIASVEKNLILLTERGQPNTLGRELYDTFKSANVPVLQTNFEKVKTMVYLEGEELEAHWAIQGEKSKQAELDLGLQSDDDESVAELMDEDGGYFDIIVKDSHQTVGFFKQSMSFKMFPATDERARLDDYGETLNWQSFLRLEQKVPEKVEQVKKDVVVEELPHKFVEYEADYSFVCKLVHVDFEGRSDGRSIRNIIQQIAPKKLILIHGSREATASLREFCEAQDNLTKDIFDPQVGEAVNVSVASDLYQVVLTDSLMTSMRITQVSDRELSLVAGSIKMEEHESQQRMALECQDPSNQRYFPPLLVGELKISHLRTALQSQGFDAVIRDGVLHVKNLSVHRGRDGLYFLRGPVHRDYYKVRDILYSLQSVIY